MERHDDHSTPRATTNDGVGDGHATSRTVRTIVELGRGGMGVVELVLARGPAGFAKLKVRKRLRPDFASEPSALRMFLEEGRLSSRLHHPNIVQTNEVGFDGDAHFLEMEYLEGKSLEALANAAEGAGGLPVAIGMYVVARVLAGLHYAHEATDLDGTPLRLVHRDVSPHNVFVTFDGEVKVLDFGIAKAVGSLDETSTGVVKGKITYMAPEQAARRPLDRRADLFAVGIIVWQILAGERLWKSLDALDILLALRGESVPPPSSVRPCDATLEAICLRALARTPDARFATAEEMRVAIEAWLAEQPDRVDAPRLAETMQRFFSDDRAAAKATIERALRGADEAARVDPHASTEIAVMPSATGATAATGLETRVHERAQLEGLRAVSRGAIAIALVASLAAVVATVKGRRAASRPSAAASTSASALVAARRACVHNVDCGSGSICRVDLDRCVALASPRCKVVADASDLADDRTLWIGTMFPASGPVAQMGHPAALGVELARRDFVEIAHGVPSR